MLPALRYGQAMENEAVEAYLKLYRENHSNVKSEECGIFVCKDIPFVGGSLTGPSVAAAVELHVWK